MAETINQNLSGMRDASHLGHCSVGHPALIRGMTMYEILNSRMQRVWKRTFTTRAAAQAFLERKVTAPFARAMFYVRAVDGPVTTSANLVDHPKLRDVLAAPKQ